MALYALIKSLSSGYHDWEITIMFYALSHKIQEHAVLQGRPKPDRHPRRPEYAKIHLRGAYRDFRWMYTMGIKARYNPAFVATTEMRDLADRKCMRVKTALS